MARPIKNGLDYFPLDCQLDDKFELIEAEFGLTGFAVVVKLLQKIYAGQGYYCEWTNEVALLFGKKIGLGRNAVSEIVEASIKRGMFDKRLYEKYKILTSENIQEVYFEAVSRRKKVEVKKEYLLIKCTQNIDNADISGVNVYINPINDDINQQSKVKESKEKYSKGEYDTSVTSPSLKSKDSDFNSLKNYGKYKRVQLTENQYSGLVKDFGRNKTDYYIKKVDEYCQQNGKHYNDYDLTIRKWLAEDKNKQSEHSYDLDEFDKFTMNCVPKISE